MMIWSTKRCTIWFKKILKVSSWSVDYIFLICIILKLTLQCVDIENSSFVFDGDKNVWVEHCATYNTKKYCWVLSSVFTQTPKRLQTIARNTSPQFCLYLDAKQTANNCKKHKSSVLSLPRLQTDCWTLRKTIFPLQCPTRVPLDTVRTLDNEKWARLPWWDTRSSWTGRWKTWKWQQCTLPTQIWLPPNLPLTKIEHMCWHIC